MCSDSCFICYIYVCKDGQTVDEVSRLITNLVIKQQSKNILLTEIPFNIGSNYQRLIYVYMYMWCDTMVNTCLYI